VILYFDFIVCDINKWKQIPFTAIDYKHIDPNGVDLAPSGRNV